MRFRNILGWVIGLPIAILFILGIIRLIFIGIGKSFSGFGNGLKWLFGKNKGDPFIKGFIYIAGFILISGGLGYLMKELDKPAENSFSMKEKCHKYDKEWSAYAREMYLGVGSAFYSKKYNTCIGSIYQSVSSQEDPWKDLYDEEHYILSDILQDKTLMDCHIIKYYDEEPRKTFRADESLPSSGGKSCPEYYNYLYNYLSK